MKSVFTISKKHNRGQAMVEYILIASLLIAASFGAVRLITGAWKTKYARIASSRAGTGGMAP